MPTVFGNVRGYRLFFYSLARDVWFTKDAIHLLLADGREVAAPLQWFPRLLHATARQRTKWELIGDGLGIHWPLVDEDIEVESLLLAG